MKAASTLVLDAAYSLMDLSRELEKHEKTQAAKFLFLAQTYYPAYQMTGIYETAQDAIDAVLGTLKEGIGPEMYDSGWVFYGPFKKRIATIHIKKIGSWDDWGTMVPETDTTRWSAR
jgi:hypothetical protein